MTQPEHAPVERRHRLAVLRAQDYQEAWLAERPTHQASRWLEHGGTDLAGGGMIGRGDKLAQEIANAEAAGRQDREAYAKGLRQILDRIDRAIAEEVGQPLEPTVVEKIPAELQAALERLAGYAPDGDDGDFISLASLASGVVEAFRKADPFRLTYDGGPPIFTNAGLLPSVEHKT